MPSASGSSSPIRATFDQKSARRQHREPGSLLAPRQLEDCRPRRCQSISTPGQAVSRRPIGDAWSCPPRYSKGTSVAYWLFSQTNRTGSFQMEAKVQPLVKVPLLTAPSPKKATATCLLRSSLKLSPRRPLAGCLAQRFRWSPSSLPLSANQVHAAADRPWEHPRALVHTVRQSTRERARPWQVRAHGRDAC